jgi:hypothetical protein
MKSFKQFLSEEEARQGKLFTNKGTAQDFRNPKKIPFTGTDPVPSSSSSGSSEAPKVSKVSPGQMEIPSGKSPTGTTTKVPGSKVRGAAADPWKQFPKKPQQQLGMPKTGPSSSVPGRTLAPAGGTSSKPALPAAGQTQKGGALAKTPKGGAPATNPPIQAVKVSDVTKPKGKLPSGTKGGALATRPVSTTATNPPIQAVKVSDVTKPKGKLPSGTSSAASSAAKQAATKTAAKTVGKGILKGAGKLVGPASAALDVADERSKGSGWARSLAKGAVVAAGGALGGAAGSVAGPVGTVGGAVGGSMAASKAFDTAAGANAVQRKAIATANRQGQSGGAIKGIGGKTSFDTKKNTITTGTGSQRKTAQLGKTSVVTGPGGKQDTGYLAYKGGKAVYKRADTKSLAQTSSNPLERIGRSLFAGAYKKSDAANAAKKLATARQSDAARNKALGVKFGPGK